MFTIVNTTHEEAVRLLNDRDAKTIDLYNTIAAYQKRNLTQKALLFNVYKSATEGEISQQMRLNPFSIPEIKEIGKYLNLY
jgi:hypothetical protein